MNNVNNVLGNTINNTLATIGAFLPRFISGLIVLILGIIIASFLKQIILQLFKFIKLEAMLKKYGVPETKEGVNWSNILAELIRWFVIILFLVPTAEVWGLGKFVEVLNGLLAFIPNVIIAVLLLLVGFVIARLVYDVLRASLHGLSPESARNVARAGKWAVLVFVFLVVLNQLGIASDLIRILFGGIVAMIALAGGLAFGLGGKDTAAEILEKIKKNW
jgi:hypothetical protein